MTQLEFRPRPLTQRELEERVAEASLEILTALGGCWIQKQALADRVFRILGLFDAYAATTRERRVKAAIQILRVDRRKLISSTVRGYALCQGERPDIRRQVAEIRTRGETIRAVAPALADALTPFFALAETMEALE